jgi:excisionase family DNA binding protein
MTDDEPEVPDDPWMTLAEFAEELRVRPVTVRSWIAKGQLKATRGGQRKWLVRRSELDRMLAQGRDSIADPPPPPPPVEQRVTFEYLDHIVAEVAELAEQHERTEREQALALAGYEWDIALEQSRMAPPDARFVGRIRHIAEAAVRWAAVIRDATRGPGFSWTPIPDSLGLTLSYELRPGGNRPGPKDAWDRVDRVVNRLGEAMEGTSAGTVATTLRDLASALKDVADAIEKRPALSPSERKERDSAEGDAGDTK